VRQPSGDHRQRLHPPRAADGRHLGCVHRAGLVTDRERLGVVDRLANRERDGQRDHDAHAHQQSDAQCDRDAHAYADPDAHADPNTYADPDAHANPDPEHHAETAALRRG
jgi:hypothetical protein